MMIQCHCIGSAELPKKVLSTFTVTKHCQDYRALDFFACQNFRPAVLFHSRIRLEYSLMHDIREGQHTALRLYRISKRWFCPQCHCSLVWHRQSDLVVNNALSLSIVKWFQWRFCSSGLVRFISPPIEVYRRPSLFAGVTFLECSANNKGVLFCHIIVHICH